jgi:hypothetical protein
MALYASVGKVYNKWGRGTASPLAGGVGGVRLVKCFGAKHKQTHPASPGGFVVVDLLIPL